MVRVRIFTYGLIKIGKTYEDKPMARTLTARYLQVKGGKPVPPPDHETSSPQFRLGLFRP